MKNACPNSLQRLTRRTRRTWPSTRSTYEDCSYRAPDHLRATKVHFSQGFPRAPARVWATQYSRMRASCWLRCSRRLYPSDPEAAEAASQGAEAAGAERRVAAVASAEEDPGAEPRAALREVPVEARAAPPPGAGAAGPALRRGPAAEGRPARPPGGTGAGGGGPTSAKSTPSPNPPPPTPETFPHFPR